MQNSGAINEQTDKFNYIQVLKSKIILYKEKYKKQGKKTNGKYL